MRKELEKAISRLKVTRVLYSALIFLIVNIIGVNQVRADAFNEASKLWNKMGGKSVATGASIYQTQRAGNITLGSIYLSNKKRNRPLISVTYPEIKIPGTCTGTAVMSLGGISFISGDELKNKLTSVVANAGMGFVYMGLSSVSPVLSETLQEVYSKLQEFGGFLSNECQLTEELMNYAKDKASQHLTAKKKQVTDEEITKGGKADLESVYKGFPKGSGEKAEEIAKKNPEKRLVNVNLAWDSLNKLGVDEKTKTLMMTISGTIIIHENPKDKDGEPSIQYIAPKIVDPQLLDGLLKGDKSIKVLGCQDKGKCLKVKEEDRAIPRGEGFEYKVSQHFDNFKTSLKEDVELAKESANFLGKSGLPVYMMYGVLYRKTGGHPETESNILIQITAWNILFQYLTELINDSIEAANNFKIGASEELDDYRKSLIKVREMLNQYEMQDNNRHQLQIMLVDRTAYQKKELKDKALKRFDGGKHDL